jgi:hypothetical protein
MPGHIMHITSPLLYHSPGYFPRALCTCKTWETDDMESADAARDAHAEHLVEVAA